MLFAKMIWSKGGNGENATVSLTNKLGSLMSPRRVEKPGAEKKRADELGKQWRSASRNSGKNAFMCTEYNFPRGKATSAVSPAKRDFNVARVANALANASRGGRAYRTSRVQGREIIAIVVVYSPRMCARPLKIRWKGKKRTRYLHILRGCGKYSTSRTHTYKRSPSTFIHACAYKYTYVYIYACTYPHVSAIRYAHALHAYMAPPR